MSAISIGSVIDGRYRIEKRAGSGGMADVYRATHLRLEKTVAVKVMSPALADDPGGSARVSAARSAGAVLPPDRA